MSLNFDTMFAKKQAVVVTDTSFDKTMKAFRRFFEDEDETGPELAEVFTVLLNNALREKPVEDYIKLVIEKHPRPGNLAHLVSPKNNPEVYAGPRKGPLIVDRALRKIQKVLGAAVEPVIRIVDDIGSDKAKSTEAYLEGLMDTMNYDTMNSLVQPSAICPRPERTSSGMITERQFRRSALGRHQ